MFHVEHEAWRWGDENLGTTSHGTFLGPATSARNSRYIENVTTLESIESQIDYLQGDMGKAGTWDKLIIAKEIVVRHLAH